MWSRREFLSATAAAAVTVPFAADAFGSKATRRKRMAIVTTLYKYGMHGQHMGDRFLHGYPMNGRWNKPRLDTISLYADQHPIGDLSEERAKEFGFRVYPTIAEALRAGGDRLAVDGIALIGEHGNYPDNEFGQRKYPRYEFFEQIVEVFKQDGRSVPVFNDKHLSWKWEWAKEMVDTSHSLGFPLMAGSSLPVTWRMPDVDLPWQGAPEELMCLAYGGRDSYDFHALEVIQCMAERRRGGETGVAWVEGLDGHAVWEAQAKGSWQAGGWSPELFEACLARTQQLIQPRTGWSHWHPTPEEIQTMVARPAAYRFQYADGTRATMLLFDGLMADFTFAAKLKNRAEPLSTLFHLPPRPNVQYSAILMSKVEDMFLSGKAPYPVERTLLTSGILAAALQSLKTGKRLETPHLNVRYAGHEESLYCRK